MDEFKQVLFLMLLILMFSFLFGKLYTYKRKLKLPSRKLRFNQFSTHERHVINEAVIDMLREYNFKSNKSDVEIKKHESLQQLKEELRVFIR